MVIKSAISASRKKKLATGLFSVIKLLGNELILYHLHRRGVKKARVYAGETGLKFEIGCGHNQKHGWINIDLSSDAKLSLIRESRFHLTMVLQ